MQSDKELIFHCYQQWIGIEIKSVLSKKNCVSGAEIFDVSYRDLANDPDLVNSVQVLYSRFNEFTPFTLKQIEIYVRNHFNEFVDVELSS